MTCRCSTPCRQPSCEMHRQHYEPEGNDWDGLLCVAAWIVFIITMITIGSTIDWETVHERQHAPR